MDTDASATEFLSRHREGNDHEYLRVVAEGITSGTCRVSEMSDGIACDEILDIYRGRALHLAGYRTEHAERLLRDVVALCANLESVPGQYMRWWSFKMTDGVSFQFAELDSGERLLGSIRTVSKLAVSEATWRELWGDGG